MPGRMADCKTPATALTAPGCGQAIEELDVANPTHLRTACTPFDGPEAKWRAKAVQVAWIEHAVDNGSLSWPTPICGTSLCLTFKHLAWESPRRLAYPAGVCVYCGVAADTMDHLLPRTWTGEAVRRRVLTVPACQSCNSTISDRYVPSITERRKLAQRRIRARNARLLRMPEWTAEQLAELGKTLRSSVERGVHDRKLARARLAWPEDPDYDLRAMQLSGIENPYELGLIDEPGRRVC